jgi:hypothetical protein
VNPLVLLPIHVAGGTIAIVSGLLALYAFKGGKLHRKSGSIFGGAMLVMSVTGGMIAVGRPGAAMNIPAALITAYLVITGIRAVRPGSSLQGSARLRSHLWRMSTALFVASASFFLGPVRRIPEPLRLPALRLIPLAVLLTMAYWLWRLRRKRTARGVIHVSAPEAI